MKFVQFRAQGDHLRPGIVLSDGRVLDLTHPACGAPAPADPNDWFDLDGPLLAAARAAAAAPDRAATLGRDEVAFGPPVPRPRKVLCIGLNYRDHAEESGLPIPEEPLIFSKLPTCVIGPGDTVQLPPASSEVDYEAELAVVIGRRVAQPTLDEAAAAVFGYTCLNDVSARDFQFRDGQWQRGKSCDTFCPLGPFVATTDEVSEPEDLKIRLRLNGEVMQDSSTNQLIFGIARIIQHVAETITLEPGDVIATGTPPGVGFARKPPVYLKAGDRMDVAIEGLGVLSNPVR